jgi:hypothetical protein
MMPPVVYALLGFVAALFRSRASLSLENLALRHQLAVYQQTVHHPRVRPSDRLFWTCLSRLWAGWQAALAFVQPRTILAWHHQRFRDHRRGLSQRGTPGRPAMVKEVRQLIRVMWQANPMWGSPRMVGELRKVGIDVAKSTSDAATQATVADVEDLSYQSRAGSRGPRFLCRADCDVQSPLRLADRGSSPPAGRPCFRH